MWSPVVSKMGFVGQSLEWQTVGSSWRQVMQFQRLECLRTSRSFLLWLHWTFSCYFLMLPSFPSENQFPCFFQPVSSIGSQLQNWTLPAPIQQIFTCSGLCLSFASAQTITFLLCCLASETHTQENFNRFGSKYFKEKKVLCRESKWLLRKT